MHLITRRGLLALPVAIPLLADRWSRADFPAWDQEFIDRLVTDSPWAHPWEGTAFRTEPDKRLVSSFSQIGIGLPQGIPGVGWPGTSRRPAPGPGNPLPREQSSPVLRIGVDLTIRWASALPIRRALALQQFGRDGLDSAPAREVLAEPDYYLIELAGMPRILAGEELKRDLAKTRLNIPGQRVLAPLDVTVPTIGTAVTARLKFPRLAELPDDLGNITLTAQTGSLRIEEKFKAGAMMYEGRLEL